MARDKDGDLYLYEHKPVKLESEGYFTVEEGQKFEYIADLDHLFPSINWENSPQRVTLKLENNETFDVKR